MNREGYINKFRDISGAISFENYVLQNTSREFLPECATWVLDGNEPDEEYWKFLISQLELEGY